MQDTRCLFFCNTSSTTEVYTLSLHDALPISFLQGSQGLHFLGVGTERLHMHPGDAHQVGAFAFVEFIKVGLVLDRKSTRLNSSHVRISYAVFCLKKKKNPMSSLSFPSTPALL